MNNQVENVLMISQLEKEKIELEMKMMDLNKLVQLAIDRVELLSGSVGARITKKFDKKENIFFIVYFLHYIAISFSPSFQHIYPGPIVSSHF